MQGRAKKSLRAGQSECRDEARVDRCQGLKAGSDGNAHHASQLVLR